MTKPARSITMKADEMEVAKAAKYVGVSVNAVYHRRDHPKKKLIHRYVFGVCVFSRVSLDEWRRERKADAIKKLAAIK